jgi:hypothetical protein
MLRMRATTNAASPSGAGRFSPWTKSKKGKLDGPDLAGWVITKPMTLVAWMHRG